MSAAATDSSDCAAVDDDIEDLSTWVDSFSRLNYYLSDSTMILCFRLIDIVLLSLGLYYGTGVCRMSNPLAVVSICLLAFDGIDLSIILVFLIRKCVTRNRTVPEGRVISGFKGAVGIRIFFIFFKLIASYVGTGYAFNKTASMNLDCEFLRICLGIVCYSSLIKMSIPKPCPTLPIRRLPIEQHFGNIIFLVFNGVYVGVIFYGTIKTKDSACMYTNMEDFYFRAPLQLFAYIGVILVSYRIVMNVLYLFLRWLLFRFPTWQTAIIRLLGVHYALYYVNIVTILYYFSVGAILLFRPRSGGSCRLVAPNLFKTLLVWQWIYTLWVLIAFPVFTLLFCLGTNIGCLLAACLPASITVRILEAIRAMAPEGMANLSDSNEQDAPATQSTIEALPMVVFGQESNQFNLTECAICRTGFEPNEQVKRLQCGHFFHGTCVATWLAMTRICPVCRQRIPSRNR